MALEPIKIYNVSEPFLESHCQLGEGPYYDKASNVLRFVAPRERKLHFVDLATGPQSAKAVDTPGTAIGVTANIEGCNTHFAFAGKDAFAIWDVQNSTWTSIKELWSDEQKAAGEADKWCLNDGAVDTKGRFWAGMMTMTEAPSLKMKREGCLMRFDAMTGRVTRMIESLGVPNGISWSPDDKTMYHTDSVEGCVHAYDYDSASGNISNKRVMWAVGEDDMNISNEMIASCPDGHAMDEEGHLWIALFFGSKVVRVSPQGKKVAEIRLPARCATCPAFGGKDFDELYITTATDWMPESASAENIKQQGNVFKCKVGVKGRRPNLLKLDMAKFLAGQGPK